MTGGSSLGAALWRSGEAREKEEVERIATLLRANCMPVAVIVPGDRRGLPPPVPHKFEDVLLNGCRYGWQRARWMLRANNVKPLGFGGWSGAAFSVKVDAGRGARSGGNRRMSSRHRQSPRTCLRQPRGRKQDARARAYNS